MNQRTDSGGPVPASPQSANRRLPIGAEVMATEGVHFRVWAPKCQRIEVVFAAAGGTPAVAPLELVAEDGGYFAGVASAARAGMLYRFRLNGSEQLVPDPASRFQPDGPHGPSQIIEPGQFAWSDSGWRGAALQGQVLYELHIGTFTGEGTWRAAQAELDELKKLGITVLEVMPVNEFAGRFGWGYDGVDLFAPTHLYGKPDDFRRFVDRAHSLGIGVILDVVYNHLGPDGCYLKLFSEDYFSVRHTTDWGEAINYDGDNCQPVREFFRCNAGYWIAEYHLDGLRLDATQNIYDDSTPHIVADIAAEVKNVAAPRATIVIAENESQDVKLVRPPSAGGCGLDGMWNDDFHHSARVALTGEREAYYTDYLGSPQELISAVKWGFLYQGQWYTWQKQRRGTPTRGLKPSTFVTFLENHDQICNSGFGDRIHFSSHPGCYRALTALLLLGPGTPLLFMGQEFGASSPFVFFADHKPELAKLVYKGRLEFVSQFTSLATPESQARIPDPAASQTFEACKLKLAEREEHKAIYQLHRDLLKLRHDDTVFSAQGAHGFDGAVLAPKVFVLRFFGQEKEGDRLLVVNLDVDFIYDPAPEPLVAPPEKSKWQIIWSSESPVYGGRGVTPFTENWKIPGYAAIALTSVNEA
ncbi:MAG TPA: malto-oligosyltrehalose trehalohydrolase [Candidatus Limnocylindria bacterium]|nr:malto-oligosyltrehalose trehalohydrolase [Candidatus Limnocylindria bacterium]